MLCIGSHGTSLWVSISSILCIFLYDNVVYCSIISEVIVVVVIVQQLFSYHQLSRLRRSATVAGLSRRS